MIGAEDTMSRCRSAGLGWMLGCLLAVAPAAWAQADQSIYTDALVNGWQNWSWAVVNPANGSPVHSGTSSASVNADAWEAIYLHHAAFDTTAYADLVFWIHGGATGGQLLQVQALLGGTAQAAVLLAPLPANTWQQITIPLANLGVANRPNMDGFWIQDRSGTTQPAFYVDDVRLTGAAPPAVVNVTVDASQPLRTVDRRHFGVNAAIWDAAFDTPTTIGLLTEMGNQALRFPGGSLSNNYHWQTNTSDANTWQWPTSFDEFAHVATATAAQVFISVNYGSGTPAEAAEWVRHSNVTRGYGFKYWEIGNENYGSWETDVNVRPHDPHTYATRFKQYSDQMKAVDPTIKVGAVAVTGEDSFSTYNDHPATNPRTGQVHNGWTPVMLATLAGLGVVPDFLVYHRYPQAPSAESDAGLLQSSTTWGADAADLRQQLTDYLGAAGAAVELVCTENNSVFTQPGKQTTSLVNGLFLADSLGTVMKTEFNALLWWDLRNAQETGNNNAASLYGWRLYGDYGIVTDATPAGPADRYPTFYVAKLLQHFARGGDRRVEARSDSSLLAVHAARRMDGSLTLLAINKTPATTLDATIALRGYSPVGTVPTHAYGIPQDEAARTGVGSADVAAGSAGSVGPSFAFSFPPYSVTVLSLSGAPSLICCRDFNGDGKADILWRHTTGTLAVWLLNGTTVIGSGLPGGVSSEWSVVGAGDFNGDGKADLLWRHTSGALAVWLLDGSGIVGTGSPGSIGNEWAVVSVGDFNGDGKADILWRHTTGTLALWLLDGFALIGSGVLGNVPPEWSIAEVGDFNGDGKADVLWQHASGTVAVWFFNGLTVIGSGMPGNVSPGWAVAGVGDFNGDGKADILWRHLSGTVAVWLLNGSALVGSGVLGSVSSAWTVAGVGDFNGDGKADILWRDTAGTTAMWFMNGAAVAGQSLLPSVAASWTPQ